MQPNYMSMSGYGQGYQPMAPLALTQPEAIPSWMPAPAAPVQRTFPMASAMALPSYDGSGNGAWLGATEDLAPALTNVTTPGGGSGWNWLNTRDQQGVLGPALAGAQSLASLFMGMKQYGLAKDQLAFQKDSFNKQYDTNRTLTNSRLEDRQKARVASNASAYQSVGDYMNQNGVK